MPERDDFQGSTRGASLSWDDRHNKRCFINQWRGGLILSVERSFATKQSDGKPKFWPDAAGNPDPTRPVKQRIITVVTNEKGPNNPVDTGIRSIYIEEESRRYSKKGKYRPGEPKEGTKYGAYLDALAEVGVPGTLPEPGGYFYLCQTGEVEGAGDIPRKTWIANYQRPTQASLAELDRHIGTAATQPVADDMAGQSPAVDANPYGNGQPQQAPSAPPAPPQQQPQGQPQGAPTYQPPAPPQGQPAYANNGAPPARPQQHQSPPPPPQPQHAAGPYQ